MKNCRNCKYAYIREGIGFCVVNSNKGEIKHPMFMGGPKKCECYEKVEHKRYKYVYPKKEELTKTLLDTMGDSVKQKHF